MNKSPDNKLVSAFLYSFLCSFSQIMLQKSAVIGLLLVVGIGVNSPLMLLGAVIAVLSSLMVAQLLQYDADDINTGLYGYNAALTGMAVFFFLPANLVSFILVILTGVISTVTTRFMLSFTLDKLPNFPVFTVPFIILTWLLLLFINVIGVDIAPIIKEGDMAGDFYIVMRGVGQIMFQGYWLSGVIIVVGLFLHAYKVATWAIIGSVAGLVIARTFNFSEDLMHQGLYGFNASLTAIALAERFHKKFWPIFVGIVVAVFLTRAFELLAIPALTTPFVLASWIIIALVSANPTVEKAYSLNN
jgi:urea transporter